MTFKILKSNNKVSSSAIDAIKYLHVRKSDLKLNFNKDVAFEYNGKPFNISFSKHHFLTIKEISSNLVIVI